jgi:hypothetical protein
MALASGSLALGYFSGGNWIGGLIAITVGVAWYSGWQKDLPWAATWGLAYSIGAAALGVLWGLAQTWMLVAVVAALSAWDLDHFSRRLRAARRVENASELEKRHLSRLALVDGAAFLFAGTALLATVNFNFGIAFLAGLLATYSLSRLIVYLRQAGE